MNFTATPHGTIQFVDFRHKVGSIKNRISDWKVLNVQAMQERPGS
jgi:hypothetical protein